MKGCSIMTFGSGQRGMKAKISHLPTNEPWDWFDESHFYKKGLEPTRHS